MHHVLRLQAAMLLLGHTWTKFIFEHILSVSVKPRFHSSNTQQ